MKIYALDSNIISAMLKDNENIIDRFERIDGLQFENWGE